MTEYRRNLDAGAYKPKPKKAKTQAPAPEKTAKDAKPDTESS